MSTFLSIRSVCSVLACLSAQSSLPDAYYTEDSLEELRTVDDIPQLSNLQVPHECYQRARSSTTASNKKRDSQSGADAPRMRMPRRNSSASQGSQSSDKEREQNVLQGFTPLSAQPQPRFAAFPPSPVAHPHASSSSGSSSRAMSPSQQRTRPPHHHTPHQLPPSHVLPPRASGLNGSPMAPPFVVPSQGPFSLSPTELPPSSPSLSASSSHLSALPSPALDYTPDPIGSVALAHLSTGLGSSRSGSPASRPGFQLVPLERLATHRVVHRAPADSEVLRSFRPL